MPSSAKSVPRSAWMNALLALLCLCGCARDGDPFGSFEDEKSLWERKGWRYVEVVGTRHPYSASVSGLSSDDASAVVAFGFDGETRVEKKYSNEEATYLVITMRDRKNHTYSMVFVREKTEKAAEPGATDNPDDAQRLREDH